MSQDHLKKELFFKTVEALEEKISMSAYYTVDLACKKIGKTPETLTQDDLPKLVDAILEIYKEYYPHRVSDIGNHLTMRLLQKDEKPPKKRRSFFRFFRR